MILATELRVFIMVADMQSQKLYPSVIATQIKEVKKTI